MKSCLPLVPIQVSNGGTTKGIENLNSAKADKIDRLLEQKLTGSFTKLRH
jgi:hypothetical protein